MATETEQTRRFPFVLVPVLAAFGALLLDLFLASDVGTAEGVGPAVAGVFLLGLSALLTAVIVRKRSGRAWAVAGLAALAGVAACAWCVVLIVQAASQAPGDLFP
jgi:hypothetical protein